MQEHKVLEEIERTLDEISYRQAAQEAQEVKVTPPLLEGETEDSPAPPEHEQHEQPGTTIIHVYVVDAPLEEDERTIESTLETTAEEANCSEVERELPLPPTPPSPFRGRRVRVPFLLLLLCILVGGTMFFFSLVPLFTASATVTIIPKAVEISGTTTLTLLTGTPPPHPGSAQQVAGRRLSTLTLSQEQVTTTTGIGQQPAQASHGLITFYNALPEAQTVPAGTLLVGADGVQVVTEADANIPAGTLSTNGQVSVFAHTLEVGPAGNIRANDLYGPCCRADVFAQNSAAFHGGQNARDFPKVTSQDVSGAVATLKANLQASTQAALLTQVRPGETLITPVHCTPKVSANHAVGEEATQLTVRLDENCTGQTYDTQAVQTFLMQALTQDAARQAGPGYTLTGEVQVTGVTVTPSLVKDHQQGTFVLQIRGTGTWAYQFSDTQLRQIAQLIAGKNRQEATTLLLAQRGVSQVEMTVSGMGQTSLPADAGRIHLLVLSRPS